MGNKITTDQKEIDMTATENNTLESNSPDFITPSSSPFKNENSAFKPYSKKEKKDIQNFIDIIDEEFDNCQKDLVEELEKNNINPNCINTEQKREFKEKITNDIIYFLHVNSIIMHYNFKDTDIAYLLSCEMCPSIKEESEIRKKQIFSWIEEAIKRVEDGKSIPEKIKKRDLFEEICLKWNINVINTNSDISHLNSQQKKILNFIMREANMELFEVQDKLKYFKYQNEGLAAYANMQFIGMFDSIEEILEYCKGETIFEILVKNFDTNEIQFIK